MSAYKKETIVLDVLAALDENTKVTVLSSDEDTLELHDIIENSISVGINAVRRIAPLTMVDVKQSVFGSSQTTSGSSVLGPVKSFALPTDFLRLAIIHGNDWKQPVSEFIVPGTTRYSMMYSEFEGIRGNASKPFAAVSISIIESANTSIGKSVELYPATSGVFVYVPMNMGLDAKSQSTLAANDSYAIEDSIYNAVLYKIAATVCGIVRDAAGMQLLNSLCAEQLGISNQSEK